MRRIALVAVVLLALGGCASGGGSGSVPSYSGPEEMSKKAWGPVGITSCGSVDEAATLEGAHYVICQAPAGQVRFITATSEELAQRHAEVTEVLGMLTETRGSWVVGADDQATLDKAVSALS